MNRTGVQLVPAQAVRRAEVSNLFLNLLLLRMEAPSTPRTPPRNSRVQL